jgi:hypothetical protein
MFLQIIYFSTAGFCLFFSLLVLFSERLLRISKSITLFEFYFLMLSLIGLCHTLLFAFENQLFARELLILERVFGLCAGIPLLILIRKIRKQLLPYRALIIIYSIIGILLTLCFLDIIFNLNLLFYTEPSVYQIQPLFRIVFVPFSFIGLGGLALLTYLAYRNFQGNFRVVIRIFSFGVICPLPFEYWDLINGMRYKNLLDNKIYLYNIGIFLFAFFISSFIIQLLKLSLPRDRTEVIQPVKESMNNSELEILRQIYNKTISEIREKRLYAIDTISIECLAETINEDKKDISRAINRFYKGNYTNFMNVFRVEEMKAELANPEITRPIVEIGLSA